MGPYSFTKAAKIGPWASHKKPATTPKIQDIDVEKLHILKGNSSNILTMHLEFGSK